jgi:hypothetical protein
MGLRRSIVDTACFTAPLALVHPWPHVLPYRPTESRIVLEHRKQSLISKHEFHLGVVERIVKLDGVVIYVVSWDLFG